MEIYNKNIKLKRRMDTMSIRGDRMSDILFGNNNKKIIKAIADKSFKSQRQRNLFIMIAITITSFMLITTISMGFSYGKTFLNNQTKTMGTTAHFSLTNSNREQIENLKKQAFSLENVGTQVKVGSITEKVKLGLLLVDDSEWQNHRMPTIDDINGNYPVRENEIMLSTWALEDMGITEPTLGMEIPVTYRLNGAMSDTSQGFTLSGYYTDYVQTRTGNRGAAYISEEFQKSMKDVEVVAMVSLENPDDIERITEEITKVLSLKDNQEISIVPTLQQNELTTYISIALIVLIMLTAYLLIYNVLFISVSKDIAHYGQLKTLGTTKNQIEKIIYSQVIKLSFIGIVLGLSLGTLTSFVIVPLTMTFFFALPNIETVISFSPYVYIGASVFTFITVMLGSFKPARIAGKISPIEAVKYSDYKGSKKKHSKKISIFGMSLSNVFRNKKGAFYTFASLILGLTTFILVSTITASMNPKVMIENEGDSDFTIQFLDSTVIDETLLEKVQNIDGIENFMTTNKGAIQISYDEAIFRDYLEYLASTGDRSGFDLDDENFIEYYTSNFRSSIYGIDSKRIEILNETLKSPIDIEDFENGEFILLHEVSKLQNGESVFNSGDVFTDVENKHTFVIGDVFVNENFNDLPRGLRSQGPEFFVSKKFLEQIDSDNCIGSIKFDTTGTDDAMILHQVESFFGGNANVLIESRFQRIEEISGYVSIIEIVGTSISLIFMLIGILNFINTIAVSVTVRTHELALLESVGMTRKQIKRMLSIEGFFYWIIPFGFVFTIGNGLLYFIYDNLKVNDILSVFAYPTATVTIVAMLLLAICTYLPVFTYNQSQKGNIIQRLRVGI